MAKQYNNSLTNLFSYSFPGSHLLVVQLVRSIPNTEKAAASQKSQYFFMLTLAPGEKVDGYGDSGRTYKFDKSVNVKYSVHEMFSLGFVMHRYAFGQGQVVGNYVKFSKSGTGTKRVAVWESSKVEKSTKGDFTKRVINLGFSANENYVFNFSPEDANSFAEIVENLAKKALDLECTRQQSNTNTSNQVVYENRNTENSNSNSNMNSNTNSPFSNIDDISTAPTEVSGKFGDMISSLPWE